MRKLKHHEQKLLKKVDFLQWSSDNNIREVTIMRRYHVQKRDDYTKYDVPTNLMSRNMEHFMLAYVFMSPFTCFHFLTIIHPRCCHSPPHCRYNKMVGSIKKLVSLISKLHQNDPFRIKITDQIMQKLFNMGLVNTKNSLASCDKITASSFCRRRLPVVMVRLKMAQTLREAVTFVEQAHVRVGADTVTDPAFLVTRNLEDYVTWVDSSKIRRHIQKYHDALDDFDLLGN